jgi:sodium transport system permease protein
MPTIDPLGILGVLAMVVPVAVLFSAVLFLVSIFARSLKEAQSYVTPLIFIVIIPCVIGILPGIELNFRLALVPILNISLVCKEMLSGVWHWGYIAVIFGSTAVYAAGALAAAVAMFRREDVIFRT